LVSNPGGERGIIRSSYYDLSINELLIELGVLALLIRSSDESVALLLDPFPDAQLVLGGA
jgi:hypothetical protein